jgi:hypothetical protein
LSVGARSERDIMTSRTSARLPAFALALTLVDRRRLRASSSSAVESERATKRTALSHERAEAGRRLRVILARCVARRGGTLEVELVVVEEGVRKGLAVEEGANLRLL